MCRGLQSALGMMIVCALALLVTNASMTPVGLGFGTGMGVKGGGAATTTPTQTVLTSKLTLTSANNGQTFSNYRISTTSGDCVDMNGASNVTFENSDIGPCAGRGIYINGGAGNNIYDSYIHVEGASTGCCDTRDGVFVNGSNSDTLQGNVVAYSESNIEIYDSNGTIITGNFLLNPQGVFPRGQDIQALSGTPITITLNLIVSTRNLTLGPAIGNSNSARILMFQGATRNPPEDSVNIYQAQSADVENNYITGGLDATTPGSGGAQSPSGCGLIADGSNSLAANNATFKNNVVVNTGQCGISIGTGTNQTVAGNKVINENPNSGGNTAFMVWNQYTPACGPVLISGNIGAEVKPGGYGSGYWNGGGCAPVTCDGTNTNIDSCNTFDHAATRTAQKMLLADPAVTTPPLIPPLPKHCVANSPYSTQTSLPPCWSGGNRGNSKPVHHARPS